MIVRSYESMGDKTTYIEGLFIESTKDEDHHLLQLTRVVVDGQKQSCPVGATVKVLSDKARQNSTTLNIGGV